MASSSPLSYTFIVTGNKLMGNNIKLTFSLLIPSSIQPGGDHAPTLETSLSSTLFGILTVCSVLVKYIENYRFSIHLLFKQQKKLQMQRLLLNFENCELTLKKCKLNLLNTLKPFNPMCQDTTSLMKQPLQHLGENYLCSLSDMWQLWCSETYFNVFSYILDVWFLMSQLVKYNLISWMEMFSWGNLSFQASFHYCISDSDLGEGIGDV